MPEYPSPKPSPTFETVEEAAAYYQSAFDAQLRESARCQNALLAIREIAGKWMDKPTDHYRTATGIAHYQVWLFADRALTFSDVQDTNPGTGEGANAGFSGDEE